MKTYPNQAQIFFQTYEKVISKFFDLNSLHQHTNYIDNCLSNHYKTKCFVKKNFMTNFKHFTNQYLELLSVCKFLTMDEDRLFEYGQFEIKETYISKERNLLTSYPVYLQTTEICRPLEVLSYLIQNFPIEEQSNFLYSISKTINFDASIFESDIYKMLKNTRKIKKIIEASWLIHERVITRNSFNLMSPITSPAFADTCPLLLNDQDRQAPYRVIERFFGFSTLSEYKEELKQWFKAALSETYAFENPSNLLFIHQQFTQLLEAAFLIGQFQVKYDPIEPYSTQHEQFGQWLNEQSNGAESINFLSPHEKEFPLQFCLTQLNIERIKQLRYGLKEWLDTATSSQSSISGLDDRYLYQQFETLNKLIEAMYVLITPSQKFSI